MGLHDQNLSKNNMELRNYEIFKELKKIFDPKTFSIQIK